MLSKKQLQDVCLLHQGGASCCRYLAEDDQNYNVWYCVKHKLAEKKKIDQKITQWVQECKKQGLDPNTQNVPLADNCSGYPVLKHLEQGYDKP